MRDPTSPASFGAWLKYSATNHSGAVAFLLADFFLFFGVATLTVVQASQVRQLGSRNYYFGRETKPPFYLIADLTEHNN